MSDALRRTDLASALCAAVLAATGVFSAAAVEIDLETGVGLNYETAIVTSRVTGVSSPATVRIVATDVEKGSFSKLVSSDTVCQFPGLTAARSLVLDGYVVSGPVTNAAAHELVVMGNVHDDGWMDETPETFQDQSGTGVWSGREYARASADFIHVDTTEAADPSACVSCTVGTVPAPSRGYTIRTAALFPIAYTDPPAIAGRPIGLTTAAIDDDHPLQPYFLFVSDGEWSVVPLATCDPSVSTNWQVQITVDATAQVATYYVRASAGDSWTILGSTGPADFGAVSQAEFCGGGAITGLKGNGFDTQLVDVGIEFSTGTLYPGCNFEETVITGRVTSSVVHETDRLGGSYQVRLVDLKGNVVTTKDFTFLADGTMEFYVKASELEPGVAYKAEVVLASEAEANDVDPSPISVMGRPLTNELWGTDWLWVHETARTFDGIDLGTGIWTTNDEHFVYAQTTNGWIRIRTVSEEEDMPLDARVVFEPTNKMDSVSYVAHASAIFTDATLEADSADAVFGLTVYAPEEGPIQFMCLSNRTWQTVPRSVLAPVLGVEYGMDVCVMKEEASLHYFITGEDGRQVQVMSVDLDADLCREFTSVEITGVGYVTNLVSCGYSTELVRLTVDFDDDVLDPLTNFEASAANGRVHFEQLWDTDRTNGQLRVVIRDKYGRVVGQRRISFHDLSDRAFDYYVKGLQPGESYSVDVSAEIKDVDTDTAYSEGFMARIVTNALWATEGWIRENAATFAGEIVGSGDWIDPEHLAVSTNGVISIDTIPAEAENARVTFQATNALPKHTGLEFRSKIFFDAACVDHPAIEGEAGITIIDVALEGRDPPHDYRFAILTNGVWMLVDPDLYRPELGVEYEATLRLDQKRMQGAYLIRRLATDDAAAEPLPTVIAEYPLLSWAPGEPYQSDFYGVGRVQTHEGDGFDVRLVEISAELDDSALEPGTNFTATVAKGILRINQLWLTDRTSGTYTITIRDAHGAVRFSRTLTYRELVDQKFDVPVSGLVAGEIYDVDIVADLAGEVVVEQHAQTVMGRTLGGWIREDAATFAGEEVGTGRWVDTNETAFVVGEEDRAICIDVYEDDDPVRYTPTNDTPIVRSSTLREIRLGLNFDDVGWYSSATPPPVPATAFVGATIWCDDSGEVVSDGGYALAVLSTNGAWCVLDETRALLSVTNPCTVRALIDYRAGFVRYTLETAGVTNRVHQFDFPTNSIARETTLGFIGSGRIWSVDGDVWDPNLILGGTNEYADLDAAIRGAPGETLEPLWPADQLVTVRRGAFVVSDTNHWLTVRFPWWYYVEVTTNGDVRAYSFNQSNNWIDYAEDGDEHIEISGSGSGRLFLVKTPEGLSWIAAMATNEWISGRIELANDIDLTKHNWTPIAGFSGVFDGRSRTITGLNNASRHIGIPGGEYLYGPTNAWGRSAYGLFGTATNATFAGVTFDQVAVSNLADSVAALVGALAGNCTVSNVTVESGSLCGAGGTVAGLAGFADFADLLTVVGNTNRADIVAENPVYGEGRWAAGLLCVAGPTDPSAPLGSVVVTNNANFGTVSGTLYDADLLGGNLAEILAGATLGARFGEVHLTNNLAAGAVDAFLVRSPDNSIAATNFPAVNLAPAFWGYDANGTFLRALDANRYGAIAVDPVHRTARMLSGTFPNGTLNAVGLLNDEITASLPGSTVTMREGLESWGSIILDRDLTFDLGGFMIYTVYVQNTFVVSNGVEATVRNGEIVVGYGEDESTEVQPWVLGVGSTLHTNNLIIVREDDTFYERTTLSVNGEPVSAMWLNDADFAAILNTPGTVIELYEGADVQIDLIEGALKVGGCVVARLTDCYGFKAILDDSGVTLGYEVRVASSAAPTVGEAVFDAGSGKVRMAVGNAKPGFWYALQRKESLVSEWVTPPAADWVRATADGVTVEATASGSQGYYRVIMSNTQGGVSDD